MVKVRLDSLSARYGRREVISRVSTSAFLGGQVVAVIGPNAAGKSTLFKRIAGLIDGQGQVHLEDTDKGADGICYMPQDISASARLTAYESILLARKQLDSALRVRDADLALIDATMAALGIADLAFRNLGELSGGQRQLVSIAQTLVREPEVLLMDEPTSALDMRRQIQVLSFMRSLARSRQMVVFIALHDLNQALHFADQALVIAQGTSRGSGPCKEVITVEMLREVYGVAARIEQNSLRISQIVIEGIV